jgi:hypothetical protein
MTKLLRDVYFDDTSSKLVDQWVGASGTSSAEDDIDNIIRKSMFSSNPHNLSDTTRKPHTGIGYKPNPNKIIDELEQRLLNKKAKRKNEDLSTNEKLRIDDEKEESKLDIILSSKQKAKTSIKRVESSKPSALTSSSSNQQRSIYKPNPNSVIQSSTGSITDLNNTDNNNQDTDFKRKRTKTRSKQKNIRRDHREQDKKPIHLQFGSKEYRGRPLSKETKNVLNISAAPKKKAKFDTNELS